MPLQPIIRLEVTGLVNPVSGAIVWYVATPDGLLAAQAATLMDAFRVLSPHFPVLKSEITPAHGRN